MWPKKKSIERVICPTIQICTPVNGGLIALLSHFVQFSFLQETIDCSLKLFTRNQWILHIIPSF